MLQSCWIWKICYYTDSDDIRGGGPQKFFELVCATQVFQSRVSRTDFFGLKLGSGEQIFAQICVLGAEI